MINERAIPSTRLGPPSKVDLAALSFSGYCGLARRARNDHAVHCNWKLPEKKDGGESPLPYEVKC